MWTKTAKSPAFSNFLFSSVLLFLRSCFFFGLASGSLRARGFSFAFGSQKANSVGLYSSPGAFSSVLSLAPCGPGAFLLPFTRQRQAAPVFAVSPVPFEALYAGLFSISKQQTGSALFSPKSAPPHSGLSKSGYNKNAPYDQRPNGALWWALRNSNP